MQCVRNVALSITLLMLQTSSLAAGELLPEWVIAVFFFDHRSEPRGPARSPVNFPPAQAISQRLIESPTYRQKLRLSEDFAEEFKADYRRAGQSTVIKVSDDMLSSIDQRGNPYYRLLTDYLGRASAELASELLRLEGMSAIRHEVFDELIGISLDERTILVTKIEPVWDQAASLHRAVFEKGQTEELIHALEIQSTSADLVVLRALTQSQLVRLSGLLSKDSNANKWERPNGP